MSAETAQNTTPEDVGPPTIPLVLVEIGGAWFGFPAGEVVAAVDVVSATPIPAAPSHILGFVLLGERPVAAFDPGPFLGLGRAGALSGRRGRVLVLRAGGLEAGVVVSRALGVVGAAVEGDAFESPQGRARVLDPAWLLHQARATPEAA